MLHADFLDGVNDGAAEPRARQPERLASALFDFQLQGLHFMHGCEDGRANQPGGILADEQGVGKTLMCAALVASRPWVPKRAAGRGATTGSSSVQECGATLICCTASIEQQWLNELSLHTPDLNVVVYRGRVDSSDEGVKLEVDRMATADIVLVNYNVLTRELRPIQQAFETAKEKRAGLGLRVREQDDESRPSPLKYLKFWRVVLDEVQKAPGKYAAGKTVRLVEANIRWAVSGTPMEHGQMDDIRQLIEFVKGRHSEEATSWAAASVAHLQGKSTATTELRAILRPFFLRRTKALLQIGIPPQTERRYEFDLSLQEQVLHAEFVLPSAIRHYERFCVRVLGSAGQESGMQQAQGLAPSLGYGKERQMLLIDHVKRSLQSPSLWSQWGLKAKRAMEIGGAQCQQPTGVTDAARHAEVSRGTAIELVGELVDDWDAVEPPAPQGLPGAGVPLHITSANDIALWPVMLRGARADVARHSRALRELVEKHAFALGEVQMADLEILQQLCILSAVGQLGYCGAPIRLNATSTAPLSYLQLAEHIDSQRQTEGAEAVAHVAARLDVAWGGRCESLVSSTYHECAEVARRRALTSRALDIVLRTVTLCSEGELSSSTFAAWACSSANSDSVTSIFRRFLSVFFNPDNMSHAVWLANSRPVAPVSAPTRWAEVVPLLSLRMTRQTLSKEELTRYKQGITEMWRVNDAGIHQLARTSPRSAMRFLFALSSALADNYEAMNAVVQAAHRLLAPTSRQLHNDWRYNGWENPLPSRFAYLLIGERRPANDEPLDKDERKLDRWFEASRERVAASTQASRERVAASSRSHSAMRLIADRHALRLRLLAVRQEKEESLERDRLVRLDQQESKRIEAMCGVEMLRERYLRLIAMAEREHSFGWNIPRYGSSKLAALVRLLQELPRSEKSVVFVHFSDSLQLVARVLRKAAIGAIALKRDVWCRSEWRGCKSAVEVFRTEPQCRVLILEAGQSAAGLTLTCASHVIFVDVLNSAQLEAQAAARVARIGQKSETTVWHLVARGSADELLRDMAERKVPLKAGDNHSQSIIVLLRRAQELATRALMCQVGKISHEDDTSVTYTPRMIHPSPLEPEHSKL